MNNPPTSSCKRLRGSVFEEFGDFGHSGFRWFGLGCGNGVKGEIHREVYCNSVIEEGAHDALDGTSWRCREDRGSILRGGDLWVVSVDWLVPLVGGMARRRWWSVGETFESGFGVFEHGEGNVPVTRVVPVEGDAEEFGAGVVGGDFVEGLEGGEEVVEVGLVGILDTKVINDKGKCNGVGFVLPERWGVFDRGVSVWG